MPNIIKSKKHFYFIQDYDDNLADLRMRKDVFKVDELLAFSITEPRTQAIIIQQVAEPPAVGGCGRPAAFLTALQMSVTTAPPMATVMMLTSLITPSVPRCG